MNEYQIAFIFAIGIGLAAWLIFTMVEAFRTYESAEAWMNYEPKPRRSDESIETGEKVQS